MQERIIVVYTYDVSSTVFPSGFCCAKTGVCGGGSGGGGDSIKTTSIDLTSI